MIPPPGKLWSGISAYLGGMDEPFPTKGKSHFYIEKARSIERSAEIFLRVTGNKQRIKNLKS